MIIVMRRDATSEQVKAVTEKIEALGYQAHPLEGVTRTVIGAVGEKDKERLRSLKSFDGVEDVYPIMKPYKLAARTTKADDTIVNVGDVQIGGGTFVVIAGPCSVEGEEQIVSTAQHVKKYGASLVRGGAYKPRTSPYSFQGLEKEGLELLRTAKEKTGLGIVTELLSASTVDLVAEYTDVIQIGARNMQNFSLLKELGRTKKPILLKRGLSATLEELLMSAEYILAQGNYDVILCERGIRTFEKAYRNTLDLNAVPALKLMSHLPIIVDPTHGTGRPELIPAMSKAAIAAGADGIVVEVHPNPSEALSDGDQALTFDGFISLMEEIKPFIKAAGKELVVLGNG